MNLYGTFKDVLYREHKNKSQLSIPEVAHGTNVSFASEPVNNNDV